MQKNSKYFILKSLIALFSIFVISKGDVNADTCHHCNAPAHESKNERCHQCGRMLDDCTYFHTITPPLTVEEIVNTSDPSLLRNILMKLRQMYFNEKNRALPYNEIFDKARKYFTENNIKLPKNCLSKMEDEFRRYSYTQEYITRYSATMPKGFEQSEEYKNMCHLAKSSTPDDQEVPYPLKMKCGIFLVWCGGAMSLLSEGVLAPAGWWVSSIGAGLIIDGTFEYNERLEEHQRQRAEKARMKAEKEARDAEKKAQKDAEKIEKNRLREIEKQREKEEKEERRRQKEEARKLNN